MNLFRVAAANCVMRSCLKNPPSTSSFVAIRRITINASTRASAGAPKQSLWSIFTRSTKIKLSTPAQQSPTTPRDLMRLLRLAWPYRGRMAAALGCIAVSTAIYLSIPRVMALVFDKANKPADGQEAIEAGNRFIPLVINYVAEHRWLGFIGLIIAGAAVFGRIYLMQTTGQLIVNDLRKKAFRSLINQDMSFFDRNQVGDMVSRLGSDALIVGNTVSQNLAEGTRALATFLGCCAMMYSSSPSLTLTSTGLGIPLLAVFFVFGRYAKRYSKMMQQAIANSTQHATERFSSMRTVKSLTSEDKEIATYDRLMRDVWEVAKKEATAKGLVISGVLCCGYTSLGGMFYLGTTLIEQEQLTYGGLMAFSFYFFMAFGNITSMGQFYGDVMKGLGAGARLFEMANSIPSIPRAGGLKVDGVRKGIKFESVSFAYPNRKPLFTELSFTIPAGQTTALVGASGCGKTSVGSLLLRLYDPNDGRVMVDGVDLRDLDPSDWRSQIGVVTQDPVLFSATTMRDNICYGARNPDEATDEMLVEAARQSNCLEVIESLPNGFDTLVGEQGASNLSGGQRQRVAIARALLTKPKILLLDEATSSQDATSEYFVRRALMRLLADKSHTVLIIAHRLSTIKHADQIVVLDKGMVAEKGTYNELVAIPNGVFKNLVAKQMEGWREEDRY